ncbi:dihydroorotate dehydrogenase 2 [Bacillus sp. THAF10]|uniref:dihydroorotate dehydrogenase n=1 Tax=Bacillus sp. THAF10 TaxID=2587848 RepID=UPI001267F084|nr:dihydroorotate dehydrogenase [Bacillus sp. THAF10]QFT90274.1 dihydroorotate dehydrogenase 2 [Bacillus sp. THAF10]
MPDWSYHGIFSPILKKLPPKTSRELIHKSMNSIASLPFGLGYLIINFLGREESHPSLKRTTLGMEFANPIGLSGEIDPNLSGLRAFTHLGFGFLEIGPVRMTKNEEVCSPSIDYEKKRIQFSEETVDLETTKRMLQRLTKKQPIFACLEGTKSEVQIMALALEPFVNGFIVKSPEIYSLSDKPILLSTKSIAGSEPSKFDGIVLEESLGFDQLCQDVKTLRAKEFKGSILTSGGIIEPYQAIHLIEAGADLILLKEGYVFSGPGLPKRIKEGLLQKNNMEIQVQPGWFAYWLFGLFIIFGGLLALFFSLTSIILPYDEYFLAMKKEELWAFNERIMNFMAHDRMTLAGTMISGGIVYMQLAKHGVKKRLKWAKQAIDIAAILGFLGIFAFIGYGYFDWLHLLFWLILLPFYLYGFWKTTGINGTPTSFNLRNNRIWRIGIYGQLAFVLLGFSFVAGGIIISWIGVTSVFVSTDIQFICMPPEMLESFNQQLIPVIAHDRAGFGSALLSVGLLVLMLGLWGYQQGNNWVWWTFLIGGIPAFFAGIYIHFSIGYTTFIHLAPAYFALFLYIIGLSLSYKYLVQSK